MALPIDRKTTVQFSKFIIVGILNTAITYLTFIALMNLFDIDYRWANFWGYVVGLINSFIWNKLWVFGKKNGELLREACYFIIIFALCYGIQFVCLWILVEKIGLNTYVAQIVAMGLYTVLNYILNRCITFKTSDNLKNINSIL